MRKLQNIFIGFLFVIGMNNAFTATLQTAPKEDLGRLFSQPIERKNLDYLRQTQKLKIIIPQNEPQPEVPAMATPIILPGPITLQGFVKRSDGKKSTLWINNQAVQEESTVDKVEIGRLNQRGFSMEGASNEGVNIRITANGKKIRLKAGQVYEPETNQIKELRTVEKEKKLYLEETGEIVDEASIQ